MIEREQLEMDIVFVGAGPANLAGALHLKKLINEHDKLIESGKKQGEPLGDIEIGVIEKGPRVGAHILSGAVMDPKAIRELMPDFLEQGCPVDSPVTADAAWYLTENKKIKAPITPPPLVNKGKYIVSLSKLCEWLGEKCEEEGINIFPEFPGSEMLYDENDRVVGVRTGDKGLDKEGNPKGNFEPGIDLIAKITILGEGSRGSLTKSLTERLNLNDGKEPQVFSL
ncbi:MAG: electron transfer flavoprotein-ubiquinone oxidoreductase, partial [Pyrinomonadaceae bacterium]|nr:electron transfer flavoprotein-ubiquinone oxidoreductase [Pyrinomonadaceae bacterium]